MDPIVPPFKPKWQIYQELQEFVERCSKPKKIQKPPKVNRGPRGGPSSDRLAVLSTPTERQKYKNPMKDKYSWAYRTKHPVREGALNYVASSRIVEISAPKYKYVIPRPKPLVKKEALAYVASPRIIEMAEPVKPKRKWKKKRPVYVKKKALKYKASKRILTISQPNPRQNPPCKDGFSVVPAALTAGCSRRLRWLAKPRPIITEVKEHPINPKWRKKKPGDDEDEDEDED